MRGSCLSGFLMTNIIALLGGLFGAAIGWVLAAVLASVLGGYYGVTDFEGARGMIAVFTFGPIGGLLGLIIGVWLALRLKSGAKVTGKAVAIRLPIVLAGIAGLVAGTVGVLYWFSPILNPSGASPRLAFEIRLPAGASVPERGLDVSLFTEKNTMPATMDAGVVRRDGERPVIAGTVELTYRSSWRILELKMPGVPEHIFLIKVGARPGHDANFRDWEHVSNVGNETNRPRLATADDAYDIRYRVIWPD